MEILYCDIKIHSETSKNLEVFLRKESWGFFEEFNIPVAWNEQKNVLLHARFCEESWLAQLP